MPPKPLIALFAAGLVENIRHNYQQGGPIVVEITEKSVTKAPSP